MAANIEQIFQDFILNKIREIEDQNEDKAASEGVGAGNEMVGAEEATSKRDKQEDLRGSGSQKKHKKHKKHKSKKKKRNREKEEKESCSESGAEFEEGTKHQPRELIISMVVPSMKSAMLHQCFAQVSKLSVETPPPKISDSFPIQFKAPQDSVQVGRPEVTEVTFTVNVTGSEKSYIQPEGPLETRAESLPYKDQLLEIAKANAAAMCAKAGMPIPASLRSTVLPLALPSMAMNAAMASMTAATMTAALSNIGTLSSLLPLPSIANKPPPVPAQPSISALEENATVRPTVRSDAGMAKEFPVSSGSQHRKKEGEVLGAYGEWVPVDKTADKAATTSRKALTSVSIASVTSSSGETATVAGLPEVVEQPAFVPDNDSVFPDPLLQPVDISQAVTERIKAQRRLAENPYDVSAICMLSRAQEQVDAWAQSTTVPGLFTGSTGAQVLSSEELSTSGPQAWLKKDQFLRAAPVSGGVGEFLMRKMGWKTGEGLGRNREGTVEPIIIDFKVDRKGLVAEGEKPQKQTGGLVVTKDLMGKHPVSALIELCNKRRIMQPDFVMVHHSGPDHRKNFLFKVTVNGVDYQPQTASPNKKHAKAMAATVALQALGEVPVDGPGLYTGPVFTAASTGPLFST
ncbi:protein SON-like [Symphorus nematophorus]